MLQFYLAFINSQLKTPINKLQIKWKQLLKAIPYVVLHFSQPIGNYESGSDECHSPCINVTAGEMIISGCVNATLTVICSQVSPHLSLMVMAIFVTI